MFVQRGDNRHRTKADNRVAKFLSSCKFYTTSTTKIPSSDGRQQIVQPITNLEETLETIRQRREVEDEKDEIEELLKRKEQDAARTGDTATPVPSGDELTPSEVGLVEEEPDLRERLDKTRRERDTLGEGPDLREALDRSRREKEKETVSPEAALESDPGHDEEEREEGELDHQSQFPPTQTKQQETTNDPGECSSSTSSDEENKVYRVTPFRDEREENSHLSLSPRPFPRKWQPPRPQEDARDVHLSPPSPLYLSEPASREPVTSTTTPTRENRGPDLDDREMISQVPSTSGTQRKAKAHSPIIYRNSHVNTPRIPVWDRMGQRNSVKRRLDMQHARFDRNRLGPKVWP